MTLMTEGRVLLLQSGHWFLNQYMTASPQSKTGMNIMEDMWRKTPTKSRPISLIMSITEYITDVASEAIFFVTFNSLS